MNEKVISLKGRERYYGCGVACQGHHAMLTSGSKVSEPSDWRQGWRSSPEDCGVLSLNILEEPQSYAFKIPMLL